MKRLTAGSLLATLVMSASAHAHAVDAIVVQSTVVIGDAVTIHLFLTPGSERASAFLREVDVDGTGSFSADETSEFVYKVRRDLTLTLDGHPQPLVLTSTRMPDVADINEGTGVIALDLTATLNPPDDALHELVYENRHAPENAVYLVNILGPERATVTIVSQNRNPSQSVFRLNYRRKPQASRGARSVVVIGALLFVGAAALRFFFSRFIRSIIHRA